MNKWLLALTLATLCLGCGRPTPLGHAAAQLKAGMTQAQVAELFKEFKAVNKDLQEQTFYQPTMLFQTNVVRVKEISYWPGDIGVLGPFEYCEVYFDANNTIVGYKYSREHRQ